MMLARHAGVLALFATILVSAAVGQAPFDPIDATQPPPGAATFAVGNLTAAHWVGVGALNASIARDGSDRLNVVVELGEPSNVTFWINLTSDTLDLARPLATGAGNTTRIVHDSTITLRPEAQDTATYNVSLVVHRVELDGNVTILSGSGTGSLAISVPAPAPPAGLPRGWLIGGAAVLVAGAGAGLYAMRQRSVRRRMQAGPKRSQVMRDMELEQKLEKAREKDPGQAVVIQQEIRAAEQVRERRRELQILDAKRADAIKTMDLLRKRHESGGLTKLQYDNMVAKKQADLARIEAEIAEMERQDSGAAA